VSPSLDPSLLSLIHERKLINPTLLFLLSSSHTRSPLISQHVNTSIQTPSISQTNPKLLVNIQNPDTAVIGYHTNEPLAYVANFVVFVEEVDVLFYRCCRGVSGVGLVCWMERWGGVG